MHSKKDASTSLIHTPPASETNEKQNSLVRRFIPKGKDICTVSDHTVQKTEDWINNLPRKILGCRTSEELFQEHLHRFTSAA